MYTSGCCIDFAQLIVFTEVQVIEAAGLTALYVRISVQEFSRLNGDYDFIRTHMFVIVFVLVTVTTTAKVNFYPLRFCLFSSA